ncbi:hypothetical protein BD413DRAFT_571413 [Trametes elegans]|nr:hypothetical protein BD413DRAFT_571413 [Trametes elegans]
MNRPSGSMPGTCSPEDTNTVLPRRSTSHELRCTLQHVRLKSPRVDAQSACLQAGWETPSLSNEPHKFVRIISLLRGVAARFIDLWVLYGKQGCKRSRIRRAAASYSHSGSHADHSFGQDLASPHTLRKESLDGWPVRAYLTVALKGHGIPDERNHGGAQRQIRKSSLKRVRVDVKHRCHCSSL